MFSASGSLDQSERSSLNPSKYHISGGVGSLARMGINMEARPGLSQGSAGETKQI